MPTTDAWEELVDSDFIPHRCAKGKTKTVRHWPRTMIKLVKGKKSTDRAISSRLRTDNNSEEAEVGQEAEKLSNE